MKKITCALLKLDFAKTFDWNFLLDVLKAKGFTDNQISWISLILKSNVFVILVNGIEGNKILSKRGLRQGGPLSPHLFNLVANVFFRVLSLSTRNNILPNMENESTVEGIFSLQYANDTLLFYLHLPHHIASLKLILYNFELQSGLRINFHKSSDLILNDTSNIMSIVANMLKCKTMRFPFNYLGITIRYTKPKKEDCLIIIDKINSKPLSWKANCISRASRALLINSVLSAISVYWMSYYKFLSSVIDKINCTRRNFLWKEEAISLTWAAILIRALSTDPNLKEDWASLT